MFSASFTSQTFEYFLLILVRVASCIFAAPFFNTRGVPTRSKVGVAGCIAIMLISILPEQNLTYTGIMEYGIIVMKEGITGLLIGFSASICNSIVLFAGNMIDMDIGLSMATQFNPDMKTESTLTGTLYYYLILLLLMCSNLQTYLVRSIADSFTLIPLTGQKFDMDSLFSAMMQYIVDLFIIGFRIFLPVFACIMILNCVLGVMAKVAPQMNMFSVGMQLKVMVGFIVLLLMIFLLPNVADYIFREIKTMVNLIAEGMY